MRTFLLMLVLGAVLPVRPAFAHDAARAIPPTRLDFDATQAPKNCNAQGSFRAVLANWVASEVLSPEANRRLVIRIRRSHMGEKHVDVTLLDPEGATLGEHHEQYGAKFECFEVLYDTALASAKLLGAFEEPPPPEPCPLCPSCPACATCPACPPPPPPRMITPLPLSPLSPLMRRAYLGAGVFLGLGVRPGEAFGPQISLGFVPSARVPHLRIEIDGAWSPYALPKLNALRGDMIPLFGSLCYAPSALRLCSGLVATFFLGEGTHLTPGSDAMHMTLAASLRLGTEFEIADPFSIRLDGFALLRFAKRTFGHDNAAFAASNPLTAGAAIMGVWSFE